MIKEMAKVIILKLNINSCDYNIEVV